MKPTRAERRHMRRNASSIAAILAATTMQRGPDGAEARIELFDSGLIASRPMRDFDQALRCYKHVAGKAWGW